MTSIEELSGQPIWGHFFDLCRHPRTSKHEAAVVQHIVALAKGKGLDYVIDKAGNLIVKKPASPGMQDRKGIVLQSHLDMVPQKNSTKQHDFLVDPITPVVEGAWLHANETTLGADNGIGAAAMMQLLFSDKHSHGPLEALFTVDEECGMSGAKGLSSEALQGEILINLDSEDEGEIFAGCAGGADIVSTGQYEQEDIGAGLCVKRILISGLKGGHSGVDIHLGRASANKVLTRLLFELEKECGMRLSSMRGGNFRNAIAREAEAEVVVSAALSDDVDRRIRDFEFHLIQEFSPAEASISIRIEELNHQPKVMQSAQQSKLLNALYACPHGIGRMSDEFPGVVETSNNLGSVKVANGRFEIVCMSRSFNESALDAMVQSVCSCFTLMGASNLCEGRTPSWQPDLDSSILKVVAQCYEDLYASKAAISAIPASLECGLLGSIYPHWDMVSFGPTIRYPHSPDEKVDIASVMRFWHLLTKTLEYIPSK